MRDREAMQEHKVEPSVVPAETVLEGARPSWRRRYNLARVVEVNGLLLLMVLLIIFYTILLPETFPTQLTLRAILQASTTTAFLALGEAIVIAAGEFDLSVGYVVGLCAVLAVGLQDHSHISWPLAALIVVLVGGAAGLVNGILVRFVKIDSFIATLGLGTICYGVANWYTGGRQIVGDLPHGYLALSQNVLGLPLPAFFVLVLAVVVWVCFEFLPIGRYLYATGSNRRAAELVGIPIGRYTVGAFVATGLIVGIAGVVLGSQLQIGESNVGPEFLLPAFVGALLGATTVRPGRVNAWGTIIAVLILAVGISGLEQLGGQFFVEPLFDGSTLIVAVGLAGYAARRRLRARS
ncbi:MAG: ABC transporter permease [Acidimicrobiaceae bacterium]|nr:ABC transporter permease [Acidimicrobiaceae bacterium]